MKSILSFFVCALLLVSCQTTDKHSSLNFGAVKQEIIPITRQELVSPPPPPLPPVENQQVIKKKIVKDGSMTLVVEQLEQAKNRVDTLVKNYGAYYENESLNDYDEQSSYDLKIRVPSIQFEAFVQALEQGGGEVRFKEIKARDVTDEFIDLETRLQNKKAYLKRYNELLGKANSVKDILEIEEKIRAIEEEIESTTGRLNYLSDQVSYSTLDLSVFKVKDLPYYTQRTGTFVTKLKHSVVNGWYSFVDIILFLFRIWPFWLILVPLIYLWRKRHRTKAKTK